MPFWLDCFDFAVRAIDSGVGLALDRPPAFISRAPDVGKPQRRVRRDDSRTDG
jgi:polyene glycosyltransferase